MKINTELNISGPKDKIPLAQERKTEMSDQSYLPDFLAWSHALKDAFPSYLHDEIKTIFTVPYLQYFKDLGTRHLIVEGEPLHIPYRMYLNEVDIKSCTPKQQMILSCYFTRHSDGYIREKYLKKIIAANETWTIPYVMLLLGEYVIEILNVIYENIGDLDMLRYKKFIDDNPVFYKQTQQRVISYWDCYYRECYFRKDDYVGFKILNYFDLL